MKLKTKKTLFLVVISSFFLLSMDGCSTIKNIAGYINFRSSDKAKVNLTDKEITQLVSKVRSNRGNPDSHYLLACYYQERGRHKEAIEELNKALFINPAYIKAYNGLGVSYDLTGDFPRAIESYKKALELNPNLDYVHNNLGYSYLLQGNLEESINAFKKAISLNDQDKRFHNNLGLAYFERGQFDLAMTEFKQAGDAAKAHYNMAQLYFKKGLYDEAKSAYTAALNLNFSSTVVRSALEAANSLARIFQPDSKKIEAEQLITPPQFTIARMEESASVLAKAEEPIVQSQESDAHSLIRMEATDALGEILPMAGREAEPEELADPVKKIEPENVTAFYQLQVASLRSRAISESTVNSLRRSGYQTSMRPWKDEKGNEWYRLLVGPFMTRDEASTCKVSIEKEYRFGRMIVHSEAVPASRSELRHAAGKTETEAVVIHTQGTEKSLNPLNRGEIEISNGNGVNRMARRVGTYLNEKGLKVIRLTNANNFNHTETKIFYQEGFRQTADYMASQLPVTRKMEELKRFDRPNVKVKLVIGRDLIPHNKLFEVEPTAKAVPAPTLTAGR